MWHGKTAMNIKTARIHFFRDPVSHNVEGEQCLKIHHSPRPKVSYDINATYLKNM